VLGRRSGVFELRRESDDRSDEEEASGEQVHDAYVDDVDEYAADGE
jgi:hypothetical protein